MDPQTCHINFKAELGCILAIEKCNCFDLICDYYRWNYWAYPCETKSGTKFSVFSATMHALRSNYIHVMVSESGDNVRRHGCDCGQLKGQSASKISLRHRFLLSLLPIVLQFLSVGELSSAVNHVSGDYLLHVFLNPQ